MRRGSLIILLFGCWASYSVNASPPEQERQGSLSAIVEEVKNSTVSIVTMGESGSPKGQGSGFILDSDRIIATNYHVIEGSSEAFVQLANGTFGLVEGFVAADPTADVALIKVEVTDLQPVTLGDSSKVKAGDRVIAIGSPQGLELSVSDGIISAIRSPNGGTELIQTTAPISPGSSGGALFDMTGKVIGVTTLQLTSGQNLNFASPVNHVRALLGGPGELRPLFELPIRVLTSESETDSPHTTAASASGIWMNTKDGSEWEVRFERDYIYANYICPSSIRQLKDVGAHYFCEAQAAGDGQWNGRCVLNWPVNCNGEWILCRNELPVRSAQVSPTRFEGVMLAGDPTTLNCRTCEFDKTINEPFTLIPGFDKSGGSADQPASVTSSCTHRRPRRLPHLPSCIRLHATTTPRIRGRKPQKPAKRATITSPQRERLSQKSRIWEKDLEQV